MIRIAATDPIAVESVTVVIRGADGARIESGNADVDHGVWNYRATANVASSVLLVIEITARNRASDTAGGASLTNRSGKYSVVGVRSNPPVCGHHVDSSVAREVHEDRGAYLLGIGLCFLHRTPEDLLYPGIRRRLQRAQASCVR